MPILIAVLLISGALFFMRLFSGDLKGLVDVNRFDFVPLFGD